MSLEYKAMRWGKVMKRLISYYKPYMKIFWADMFFALLSAGIALSIPLIVRYITGTLIYKDPEVILQELLVIGLGLLGLILLDAYSRFFIGNVGEGHDPPGDFAQQNLFADRRKTRNPKI